MAQTGTIQIEVKSVDYTTASGGECQNASNLSLFGRGKCTLTANLNWSVSDSGQLTFSWGGYTGSVDPSVSFSTIEGWWVCSQNGYHLDVQFSTDGSNWQTIASSFINNPTTQLCASKTYRAYMMLEDLTNQLPTVSLSQSGYLRIFTWTLRACPDSSLPYAYPTDSASEAVAVPVFVELDYRPGATWNGSAYMSHNRSGGVANIWNGNSWVDMKTTDGGVGTGNPPLIYNGSQYVNQKKIGQT